MSVLERVGGFSWPGHFWKACGFQALGSEAGSYCLWGLVGTNYSVHIYSRLPFISGESDKMGFNFPPDLSISKSEEEEGSTSVTPQSGGVVWASLRVASSGGSAPASTDDSGIPQASPTQRLGSCASAPQLEDLPPTQPKGGFHWQTLEIQLT